MVVASSGVNVTFHYTGGKISLSLSLSLSLFRSLSRSREGIGVGSQLSFMEILIMQIAPTFICALYIHNANTKYVCVVKASFEW